ncbi:MAG: hypothetical protein IT391_15155 [Nitrospira sp.]|nr:hypothetical protein [Nitrospira sp.]
MLVAGDAEGPGEWALIYPTLHVLKLWTALRHCRRRPGERLRVPGGSRKAERKI